MPDAVRRLPLGHASGAADPYRTRPDYLSAKTAGWMTALLPVAAACRWSLLLLHRCCQLGAGRLV
jgi:hypothetical protein